MKAAHRTQIKQYHYQLVLQCLYRLGRATKAVLAAETGLSVMTIGALLQQFVEDGVAAPAGLLPSDGGRPSQSFAFCYDHQCLAAVQLFVRAGIPMLGIQVADLKPTVIYHKELRADHLDANALQEQLLQLCRRFPKIALVMLGASGRQNRNTLYRCDFPFLEKEGFLPSLQNALPCPVVFSNACGAAVLGACRRLNLTTPHSVLGFAFPKGGLPAAGMVWNGRICTGKNGFAGEISSIQPDWNLIDYHSPNEVCDAVEMLFAVCCSLVAPAEILLYGDFWNEALLQRLEEECAELLNHRFSPHFLHCPDFEADCWRGLFHAGLQFLCLK